MTQGQSGSTAIPSPATEQKPVEAPFVAWAVVFLVMAVLVQSFAVFVVWAISVDHAEAIYAVDTWGVLPVIAAMWLTGAAFMLLLRWQHRSARAPRGWALLGATAAVAVASVMAMHAMLAVTSAIGEDVGAGRNQAAAEACSAEEIAVLTELRDEMLIAEGLPEQDLPRGSFRQTGGIARPDGRCMIDLGARSLDELIDTLDNLGWTVVAEDADSVRLERHGQDVRIFYERQWQAEPLAEVLP